MPVARETPQTEPRSTAIPAWITPALIVKTRAVWQPYYDYPLTDDEAVDLLSSVGALCDVLFDQSPLDKTEGHEPPAA